MSKKYPDQEIEIYDIEFPNKGIGTWEGSKVTIKNTLPGQTVLTDVKRKRRQLEGRLRGIIKKADYEIEPACPRFGLCGGCTYQNISYEKQLEIKQKTVKDLLDNAELTGFEFLPVKPSPVTEGYRNKMEFSFGDNGEAGELNLGMRKRESYYEVADASCCRITHSDVCKIQAATLDFFKHTGETFFHRTKHTGTLRHLLVRRGFFTGEIIAALVTTSGLEADIRPWKDKLLSLELDGKIVGISHIINDSVADVVRADNSELLYGSEQFTDRLLGLEFKISTFSFFQTNSAGAEVLYSTVREFAGAEKCSTIFDLYCGTGTITQLLSPQADTVYGIEIVEEAVAAAKENAALNGITNCRFIAGDVLNMVDDLPKDPDLIILDPPREGINPKAILKIIGFNAKKLVYVSCKASSLAKDLTVFEENGYRIEKVQCVDMFPGTYHIETVVLLQKAM
ncbi:MAG: 23S rRNA (uracil(1939)-C(5))-methyltransferase RlmD [Firmicutes bacterium]|nr:23S rRNA (uracil(1939)-C(5))-methyltransferase RlmD [Bacillota bacterium]